jgi:hypothetical protein
MKKTDIKKSHATVPLIGLDMLLKHSLIGLDMLLKHS